MLPIIPLVTKLPQHLRGLSQKFLASQGNFFGYKVIFCHTRFAPCQLVAGDILGRSSWVM